MARRTLMAAAFAALTPILAGCGSSLSAPPTAPASAQSPAPGSTVAGERWNLTATFRSVTGPEACVSSTTYGPFSWLMTIERSGESIHLILSGVGDDRYEYEGTVVADVLTAASKSFPGAILCGGSRFDYRGEDHVSGRFSGDGRALTAEKVELYQLSSGETLRFYYDWSATRQ